MDKKVYQSPNVIILGGINNTTLGTGSSAHDNGNPNAANVGS
jgi:hypothetical protein